MTFRGVFLLVFLSTLRVVIPLMFTGNVKLPRRFSNVIAIGILFLTGSAFGRITRKRPCATDIVMPLLARIFHPQVAADGSRRYLCCEKNAPTAVGGYALSADRGWCEISRRRAVPAPITMALRG